MSLTPLWNDMDVGEDLTKKRKTKPKMTDLEKDKAAEKRAATIEPQRPPRVPPAEGLAQKVRLKDHMRPVPVASPKPVLTRPAPVRVAPPRQETPGTTEKLLSRIQKLVEKRNED